MKKRYNAKTLEEAIVLAERDMGASRDELSIEVISEDTKGFLGIGAKDAIIEVTYEAECGCGCGCDDAETTSEVESAEHHINTASENEETSIIKNFLDEFFELFEVKASYEIVDADDMISVYIKGATSDDTSKLIGKKGAVLDSLNTLGQIHLNKNLEEFKRLYIDIGDYRQKRQEKVRELAIQGCERARKYGTKVSLEYMTSYDRRIVHETLAGIEGVKTFSEGNEPHRRVCIIAK